MSWSRPQALTRIRDVGLIPIVRTATFEEALRVAESIIASGIGLLEITMTVPNARRVIEQLASRFGESVLVGAGTVLDVEGCSAALGAGAEFIVTPALDPQVIEITRRHDKPCIPGALTPTEIMAAWRAGADLVKVFPCGPVGGPRYIRALKGPFPQIDLVPTGGVNLETTPEYIRAGAAALAVGSELINPKAVREGRFDLITQDVRDYQDAVRSARAQLGK
jgi:2-dehydro-3-deoxyphosphogluconate aldolase/(4S)-4-hydroxy-2-oxoglutarate aldolase